MHAPLQYTTIVKSISRQSTPFKIYDAGPNERTIVINDYGYVCLTSKCPSFYSNILLVVHTR